MSQSLSEKEKKADVYNMLKKFDSSIHGFDFDNTLHMNLDVNMSQLELSKFNLNQ
jgi:hypothetical protein